MSKGSTIGALLIGSLIAFALDDDEPVIRTVTVTEEVEVPGPTVVRSSPPEELPESCQTMIDMYLGQVDFIRDYSEALGPQSMALRRAAIAAHQQDVGLINAAITEQNNIENAASGPLREVIQGQVELDILQERCDAEWSSQ